MLVEDWAPTIVPNLRNTDLFPTDPALEQVFNHRLHAELQNAPGGQGQESADDLLEFITTAITGTAEEVVGKVVHHAPKRWWSHEVHTAHNARTAVHRRLQKLEKGTAPHALMFNPCS